jgi:hypothetical protein
VKRQREAQPYLETLVGKITPDARVARMVYQMHDLQLQAIGSFQNENGIFPGEGFSFLCRF